MRKAVILVAVLAIALMIPMAMWLTGWLRAQLKFAGGELTEASRPKPIDLAMARAGEVLFRHEWTPGDPLAEGGDGLGPVFNAKSCVACHFKNGVGGSGGNKENVTVFTVQPIDGRLKPAAAPAAAAREGVLHNYSTLPQSETLNSIHADLPSIARPKLETLLAASNGQSRAAFTIPVGVHISQRKTPALFGGNLIDDISDDDILAIERSQKSRADEAPDSNVIPVGRALRLPGGGIGRFGWKAQSASLSSFVRAACANELGLGNPGQAQPQPLFQPSYQPPGLDLTDEQCNQLTAFIASLPRPVERLSAEPSIGDKVRGGRALFGTIGCADCHTPDVGPVSGLYSDLLLHHMGDELQGGGSYNALPILANKTDHEPATPGEWRTPPLWGVADSGPYMHDGRAATLEEAILLHGGQGAPSAKKFSALGNRPRGQLIAFLNSLKAPNEASAVAP